VAGIERGFGRGLKFCGFYQAKAVPTAKEWKFNNLYNCNEGFLLQIKLSQEAYSGSTQRLRSFDLEQKDELELKVIDFPFLRSIDGRYLG